MPETHPIRITHVITGLGVGGAEMSLLKLLTALDRDQFPATVVSLTGDAPLGERIRALGIPVTALNLTPGRPDPRLVLHLAACLRNNLPDILQTWMYHADLAGGLAARLTGSLPVIWNIRHTVTTLAAFKPGTRLVVRINAHLSHFLPKRIISNSESGRQSHAALGYAVDRMIVIPNGFDLESFQPNPQARRQIRKELGIRDETPLVGLCARFHPDKDHKTFFRAAGILMEQMPETHFLLWGKDVDENNSMIASCLGRGSLRKNIHLLGYRDDSPRLNAALDISTLSSTSEAFPSVVGEAMACEIPCAVTDVGDARVIVGDTGLVVPVGNPIALVEAWRSLLALPVMERAALGKRARQRIMEHYDLQKTTAEYAQLYRVIIAGQSE
jgi:glycosyltransferase involved in cell wall biosynthesis